MIASDPSTTWVEACACTSPAAITSTPPPAIVIAAALGSVSALLLAWAYARAEAQVLAPVEYTAFVWAACLGYVVFGEHVSLFTLVGAALIIAGCIVAVRRPGPGPQSEAGL